MEEKVRLIYPQEHFACHNYEKGQNSTLEIIKSPAGSVIERDLVDNEIVFLVEGRVKLWYNKMMGKELTSGVILFYPPGSKIKVMVEEDTHFVVCRVRDVLNLCECLSLERLHQEVGETPQVPEGFYMLEINDRLRKYIDLFAECVDDGLKCTYYFATKTKELFFMLRAYYTKEQLANFFKPVLSKDAQFMNLMYQNYRNVSSVQQLADLSMYSMSGFKKQFHRIFGTSASEWMREQKATRIFQDLNNSSLSIKELAERHGFPSVSAFSNFCQEKFGMPPGKIRLNIEKIDPNLVKVAK